MTRDEMDRIDRLAEQIENLAAKVEKYYLENREQIVECRACRGDVRDVKNTLFEKDGLKERSQSLWEMYGRMKWAIGVLASAVIAIGAAMIKRLVG